MLEAHSNHKENEAHECRSCCGTMVQQKSHPKAAGEAAEKAPRLRLTSCSWNCLVTSKMLCGPTLSPSSSWHPASLPQKGSYSALTCPSGAGCINGCASLWCIMPLVCYLCFYSATSVSSLLPLRLICCRFNVSQLAVPLCATQLRDSPVKSAHPSHCPQELACKHTRKRNALHAGLC